MDEYIETEDALFHYTRTSVVLEHILFAKRFRLSRLKDTGDPREYKRDLAVITGQLPTLNFPDDLHAADSMNKEMNYKLRHECKLICFCSGKKPHLISANGAIVEDGHACSKGWNKARMWSQYAEGHCGMCLVFSKMKLEKDIQNQEPHISGAKFGFVRYAQNDQPMVIDGERFNDEGIDTYFPSFFAERADDLFFRKHIDYRDEAEYRVVVFDPANKLDYLDIGSSIKGVIAGDRTSEAYYPLINQFCDELGIESRRAFWSYRTLRLRPCKPFPVVSI